MHIFFVGGVGLMLHILGYSRKNPHLPDGWHAGNSRRRGVEGSGNPGGRGGV